ncbi:MAG: KilA-N domain-containing protein [Ramlibacter sp.]|nr:KilA-N domain-containing protein [Ramlibacter sp.]
MRERVRARIRPAGKQFNEYSTKGSTKDFLEELSSETGISVSGLVQVIKGGTPDLQGSWVHPQVAINLAQWVSSKFAVQVSKWVVDWMTGKGQPAKLPYHLERYMINRTKQNWTTGQFVKVGFMSLMVVQAVPTPGDYAPDAYILTNAANTKLYKFVPHNGLQSIDLVEANELIAAAAEVARRAATAAIAKAAA